MAYGGLTPEQRACLGEYVQGRHVWDLGAGDCQVALACIAAGATRVTAVDKDPPPAWLVRKPVPGLYYQRGYFEHTRPLGVLDVVVLFWPINHPCGLTELVARARRVVYVGQNLGGTACGDPALYGHFLGRELLRHIPDRQNTMLVLGDPLSTPRPPTGEEQGGLDQTTVHPFGEFYPELP